MFLADRWFLNCELMKYIDSIGVTYCIRAKSNISLYIYNYDEIAGIISEVKAKKSEDQFYDKVLITKNRYKTKLAVSKLDTHKEAFYIVSNGNIEEAIKNYSYRFGSIEFIFKNQKSNGFYLESSKMRNIQSFTTMFGLMCVALLWLTILGVDYSKNSSKYQNNLKIHYCKKEKDRIKRLFSLFNTGLLYFNLLFNSNNPLRIKCNFILYEI